MEKGRTGGKSVEKSPSLSKNIKTFHTWGFRRIVSNSFHSPLFHRNARSYNYYIEKNRLKFTDSHKQNQNEKPTKPNRISPEKQ